jgi:hypothetical protein
MAPPSVLPLLRDGVLDGQLAALVWLLGEGGIPLVVTGPASSGARADLAGALLSIDASRAWLVIDADVEPPTLPRLSALLQGGAGLGISVSAPDLAGALERLHGAPGQLPYDAIRRLGIVVTAEETARGVRCRVAHYLRPTERDGQGHVQRRPPAILSAWDEGADRFDDYAWGITPELAERIGGTQATLEERRMQRAALLERIARQAHVSLGEWQSRVREQLASEKPA